MKPGQNKALEVITFSLAGLVVLLFIVRLLRPLPAFVPAAALFILLASSAILLVRRLILVKIHIFSDIQQWVIRTVLYTTVLAVSYLAALLLFWVNTTPWPVIRELLTRQLHDGFLALVTWPLNPLKENYRLTGQLQQMLFPVFLILFSIAGISLLVSFLELRWQQNRQTLALQQARLTALRAQMDSHFLFNTLNTIISQIRPNPALAEELLVMLSNMMRYQFKNSQQNRVPLEEELQFAREYLNLAKARFGERLLISWRNHYQNSHVAVPSFLLQPFLENCLKYGWKAEQEKLSIVIDIRESDHRLEIHIFDNGPGISAAALKRFPIKGHSLYNIQQRLGWLYGKNHHIRFTNRTAGGFSVQITIPVEVS